MLSFIIIRDVNIGVLYFLVIISLRTFDIKITDLEEQEGINTLYVNIYHT